ncbi:hypothetical protein V6N13_069706 [Hibiscus sabdariffa]
MAPMAAKYRYHLIKEHRSAESPLDGFPESRTSTKLNLNHSSAGILQNAATIVFLFMESFTDSSMATRSLPCRACTVTTLVLVRGLTEQA